MIDHAPLDTEKTKQAIIEKLKTIFDPEIPVNIYDLGLIYGIDVDPNGAVKVIMTLTTVGCPVAATFPGQVEAQVLTVEGVTEAQVELTFDPPWSTENMDEAARLQLGLL